MELFAIPLHTTGQGSMIRLPETQIDGCPRCLVTLRTSTRMQADSYSTTVVPVVSLIPSLFVLPRWLMAWVEARCGAGSQGPLSIPGAHCLI